MNGFEFLNLGDHVLVWAMNLLIQVTFVSVIGLAVAAFLGRNPALRYWTLCAALFLMLLIPAITLVMQSTDQTRFSVSILESKIAKPAETVSLESVQRVDSVGEQKAALPEVIVPSNTESQLPPTMSHGSEETKRTTQEPEAYLVPEFPQNSMLSLGLQPADVETVEPTVFGWMLRWVMLPLFSLWVVGAAFLMVRMVIGWSKLWLLLRAATQNSNRSLGEAYESVRITMGIGTMPRLLLSDDLSGPISAGILRPCVVLPTQLASQIPAEQIHDILVHEVAHVLRRDQLIVFLQNVSSAIFWLHPLANRLNRELAKAREEVCDNYVLATSSSSSYSRTLLNVAEFVQTRHPLPGAVGFFTSRWKLENRVAGLLDDTRNHAVNLSKNMSIVIAGVSLTLMAIAAISTVAIESDRSGDSAFTENSEVDLNSDVVIRGEGMNREMRLRGQVLDEKGQPAKDFKLRVNLKTEFGCKPLTSTRDGNLFEVWVPIGGSDWFYIELIAASADGKKRIFEGIQSRSLRATSKKGIKLMLSETDRTVRIKVTKNGLPVANAHVVAELVGNMVLRSDSNADGVAVFELKKNDKFNQLTAWTDDFQLGGFMLDRQPVRDPSEDEFEIELSDCREQKIRFVRAIDDAPVADIRFSLIIGTGDPNYNFAGNSDTLPQANMTSDQNGEATYRWFPDWESHGSYVEVDNPKWIIADNENEEALATDPDGTLVAKLNSHKPRKPLTGQVISDGLDVNGLLVTVQSFQGERESHVDHRYARTDSDGKFSVDCLPDATYCVCVNDADLVSNCIDLIPYESDTGKSNAATVEVSEGERVEIHLTSGPERQPMANQWINLRAPHKYSWRENGQSQNGSGGAHWGVSTNEKGVAYTTALANSELKVSVYANGWRSVDHSQTVKEGEVTRFEIHRKSNLKRTVTGQLIAAEGVSSDVADVEIMLGSMDGETREELTTRTDRDGRFTFTTKSLAAGLYVCSEDGKAAGLIRSIAFDQPSELLLQPTSELRGQVLDQNEQPVADQVVWIRVDVHANDNERYKGGEWFRAQSLKTKTDNAGNYLFTGLPTGMLLGVDAVSPDDPNSVQSLGKITFDSEKTQPRLVSRIRPWNRKDTRTLSDKHTQNLRDAKLGDYHSMVLIFNATSSTFVQTHLLDDSRTEEVMSFMHLQVNEEALANSNNAEFTMAQNWPSPEDKAVFAIAIDGSGKELGRLRIDLKESGAEDQAAAFIRKFAPPQKDAQQKWNEAFAEAKRSKRKIWARVSQRYCGPCFTFSRWLDDQHELLSKDYVFLKIDNLRDLHADEVTKRIIGDNSLGVPFHAIFDIDETKLLDSVGSKGNIGHPSGLEGKQHLQKMLRETCSRLTPAQLEQILGSLGD